MIGVPDDARRRAADARRAGQERRRKRVRQYSLGMRQRLGLAHALLGDPEVLILDEPANGLDPEGIRWMRGLLRDFADRGGTVLLSSHLLMEVEAVADQLLIIGNGRIVADGSREELLAGTGMLVRAHRRRRAGRRARRGRPQLPARRRRRLRRRRRGRGDRPRRARGPGRPHPPGPVGGRRPRDPLLRAHQGARMTVSFPRLTLVELRKMVDTRAGFWLQLAVAAAHARRAVLFCIFAETEDLIFRDAFALAILPGAILLPIIGILLVSSEWSQRTALITFTLVPKRMRVMSAKIAASLVLGAIVLVIALIVAVVAIVVVGGEWTMGLGRLRPDRAAVRDGDPHRRRVRRRLPELRARDRPVLRAAGGVGRAGLDPVPQRRRGLAGHHAHDRADDRAAADRRGVGRSSRPRSCCGWRCPWRSACTGSPRARSAPPS